MGSVLALFALLAVALAGPDPWIVIGGGAFLLLCLVGLAVIAVIGFATLRKK